MEKGREWVCVLVHVCMEGRGCVCVWMCVEVCGSVCVWCEEKEGESAHDTATTKAQKRAQPNDS